MKLFAKIPTHILAAPGHIDGLMVASDKATVANVYGPHGYDEGAPDPALSLVQVVTAMRAPCGPSDVVRAMGTLGLDVTPPLSSVQCLRDPGVRAALEAAGFDGYSARAKDGRSVIEVAWMPGTFGIVRDDRQWAGIVTVDGEGARIALTTMGRQLALDLLHEGLEVGRTAMGHGATEEAEVRAARHVLTWLVDRCQSPQGARHGFDGDAMISHVGTERFVSVTFGLDVEAAVDEGTFDLPALSPQPSMGMR